MTAATTNHTEIEELVRQTAKRLEAEGAFAEGSLDLTGDVPSTLESYAERVRRNPDTYDMERQRFIDEGIQRHIDDYDDLRYRVFPRREIHPDGSYEYVFVVQEPESPIRLKVRLSGPSEVVSVDHDRADRSGFLFHLGAHPILLLYRMTFKDEHTIETWITNELTHRGSFR